MRSINAAILVVCFAVLLGTRVRSEREPSTTTMLADFCDTFFFETTDPPRSIARLELDITGDGRPEVFLGPPGSNTGIDWVVYRRLADGQWEHFGETRFHPKAYYYWAAQARLWAYVRVTADEGGWVAYRVTPTGFVDDPRMFGSFEDEKARASAWARNGPTVFWLSRDDLRNGREDWYAEDDRAGGPRRFDPPILTTRIKTGPRP